MSFNIRAISDAQKETRRQQILAVAGQQFDAAGFAAVSITDIAQNAGVAKGTVYLYFQTKEALFLALITEEFDAWFTAVDKALTAAPMDNRVDAFIDILAQTLSQRQRFIRLIAILHTVLEQNIDLATAVAFKRQLRQHVGQTGAALEAWFPLLQTGQGAIMLLEIYALVIGIQHQAEPAAIIDEAIATDPDLALFRVDFIPTFLHAVRALLRGWQQLSA